RQVEESLLGGCRPTWTKLGLGALNVERADIPLDEHDVPAKHVEVRSLLRNGDDGGCDLAWDRAKSTCRADIDKCRGIHSVVRLGDPESGRMDVGPPGLVTTS